MRFHQVLHCVADRLAGGGEPAGVAQERPDDRRDQQPDPIQLAGQGLAARLAAGERRDLREYRSQLGLQPVHHPQRRLNRLRSRRGQAELSAVGLQPGATLRVGQLAGQAGSTFSVGFEVVPQDHNQWVKTYTVIISGGG